jgi:DNA polymerase III subunit delta
MHALDFLGEKKPGEVPPVCAVYGDESFLVRLAIVELQRRVLGGDEADFSLARFDGGSAEWRSVMDELATVAMFGGGRRLVIVDDADEFITKHRAALEDYAAAPRPTGVLVFVAKTWNSATRLAKAVDKTGLAIECKAPAEAKLMKWLVARAKSPHQGTLAPAAAEALVEIIGPELGLLDQQLAKLAVMVAPGETITPELVRDAVGGWRTKTAWELLDLMLAGNARDALVQLDRLLLSGEQPIVLLAQFASNLRRFNTATRIIQEGERAGRRVNLRDALTQAGFKSFILAKTEAQLRQLGRQRAGKMFRWLLEADLALKGPSSSPPRARLVLEQLIVRLSTGMGAATVRAR